MKKEHINDQELFFYLTGDLDSNNIARIEKHIQDCELCRNRLAQERNMYKIMKNSKYPVPKKHELKKVRSKLKDSLKQQTAETEKNSFSLAESIQSVFSTNFAFKLAGGVVLFLIGIITGLAISGYQDSSIQRFLDSSTTSIEKISFLSPEDDKVEVVVQQNTRETLQLSADDPRLIQAAIDILKNDERDNIRLKAVQILRNAKNREEVEYALVESLQSDPNPGIRLHAIQILKKFPINQKIKNVLVSVLFKDTNSGIRYEARSKLEELDENTEHSLKKNLKT
ncbi:MAG: HEAT repeat domain-containing protein [bacterium]